MKLTINKDEMIPLLLNKIKAIFPGAVDQYDISISVVGYAGDIEFEFTEKPTQESHVASAIIPILTSGVESND